MASGWLQRAGLAIANATQNSSLFPRGAAAYHNRGLVYHACGDFDRALVDFSQAIQLNPRLYQAYQSRGVLLQGRGEHRLALADAEQALSLCRAHPGLHGALPQIHVNRAISYKMLGELDRAKAEIDLALRVEPRFASAYCERGVIHQVEGHLERAMDDLDTALRLEPGNALFLRSRGYGHFYTGDFAGAAADLERSFSYEAEPYTGLMLHLARARLGSAAATDLQRNIQLLQTFEWPMPIFELLLRRQTADAVLSKASDESQHGEAAFYIGQMHLLAGQEDEAARWFGEAIAHCPPVFVEHVAARSELLRLGHHA